MAKKPTPADDIEAALAAVIGANDDESTVHQYLDTGFPPLNYAASARWDGGLPVGRLIEIAGPPSAGKTAIATRAMAAAQKQGGIVGFADHERSFSTRLAPLLGLDIAPHRFIYKKPKTFEESIEIFHRAVETIRKKRLVSRDAPICWVFDSLAAMVPQSVLFDAKGGERSAESRNMNDNTALARATAAHFPALAMISEQYDVCTIFLNQMRTQIGVMFGDPRKTTGGNSPEYYFSQRLWLGAAQIKKGTEVIGSEVTGKFQKNKVVRPFQTAKWRFMFQSDGTGRFDAERSLIDFLEAEGRLDKGKPGFVIWEGKEIGRDVLARKIEEEGPAGFDRLKALLPAEYEPPVVASIETAEPDAA